MEILRLLKVGVEDAVLRAAPILRAGGIVLYPTDTLYGLGADALSDEAVAKVKRIKGRDEGKPIHAIVTDIEMVEKYAVVNEEARLLARAFWPGSLTLILKKNVSIDSGIARDIGTFGARASSHPFCEALAREFGKPYTGTSANQAGEKPQRSVENILGQLGERGKEIDLIIDAGELPESLPSTVVDVSSVRPIILREGVIPLEDIWDAVRAGLQKSDS